MFDVMIEGGRIVDGSGNPWFHADLGIADGHIAAIGRMDTREAKKRIDARGLIVAPGFIDIHSHQDFVLPNPGERLSEATVMQGVTTELVGLCGQTAAPLPAPAREMIQGYMKYFVIPKGLEWKWTTIGEYLEYLERGGISENVAMLAGHTNLRLAVMGYEARPATAKEVEAMGNLLTQALEEGAFGLSTGLQWAPVFFSETSELIALNKVVARFGGIYTSHMRSEGDKVFKAIQEVIDIGESTGVPCHISHLKVSGRHNWGKMESALALIEDARARGIDVAPDKQPYTVENMALRACLPPWVITRADGVEGLAAYLARPGAKREIMRELERMEGEEWRRYVVDNIWRATGWENLVIDACLTHPEYHNRSVAALAAERGVPPEELFFELVGDEQSATTAFYGYESEEEVRRTLKYSWTIPESDRFSYGHPRNYGTFPRWLGRYVRDLKLVSLEEGIRKITSLPAQRCRIQERGFLREGYWADITIFDDKTIADASTFEEPFKFPIGIHEVLVNGVAVVENGKHVGAKPGQVLRRR